MSRTRKFYAVAVALLAGSLTTTGLTLAATDPNPSGATDNLLALHGRAPVTGLFHLEIATQSSFGVTADFQANFRTGDLAGVVHIPLVLSTFDLGFVKKGKSVFLNFPALSSLVGTPWVSTSVGVLDLFPFALTIIRPDLSLPLAQGVVTHQGDETTYTFTTTTRPTLRLVGGLTGHLRVTYAARVARAGQLVGFALVAHAKNTTLNASLGAVSYNQPWRIQAPRSNQVTALTQVMLRRLVAAAPPSLTKLLDPLQISSVPSLHLN
ncbi:MAG: hypothetical protein WCG86_04960 [Actinomycetota bacterium]